MILMLPVDFGYAFDYLAVLKVKLDNGLDCEPEIKRVEGFLEMQIGHDLFLKITGSQEFQKSYIANTLVFEAIEQAHRNKISAKRVQQINHKRFLAKQALQKRFWPQVELMEKKTKL